jgi:hypothetical protein
MAINLATGFGQPLPAAPQFPHPDNGPVTTYIDPIYVNSSSTTSPLYVNKSAGFTYRTGADGEPQTPQHIVTPPPDVSNGDLSPATPENGGQSGYMQYCPDGAPAQGSCETPDGSK